MKNGEKRPPGRPKGSKNKVVQLALSAREACYRRKLDPFLALADIAKDKEHPDCLRANAELAKYLQPVLKAVEHTGGVIGQPVTITIDAYPKPERDMTAPRPPKLIEAAPDIVEVEHERDLPAPKPGHHWKEIDADAEEVPAGS